MQAAIALNRFGLGARPGDRAPSDPQGWLLGQLRAFEVRPRVIAAAAPATNPFETIAEVRDNRSRDRAGQQGRRAGRDEEMGGAERDRQMGRARRNEENGRARRNEQNGRARRNEEMDRGGRNQAMDGAGGNEQMARAGRNEVAEMYRNAVDARVRAAVASDTPFVERLVHFWSNHFAIHTRGIALDGLAGPYEFDAIRPNVLGTFGEMLSAVERHPAMLIYLNQNVSIGPNSRRGGRGQSDDGEGFNENLAREILELHTMGVRSGYSEDDLRELARAMTGRTVVSLPPARNHQGEPGSYVFLNDIHEPGQRTLLGRRFAEGGEEQSEAMLMYIATRPETARHIATKLARHFIADQPPASAVSRIERAFVDSGGDLPTVYRALVQSPEAWREPLAKFKTPWDWTISAWRAVQPEPRFGRIVAANNSLGQPVWRPEAPTGFADLSSDWMSSDALFRRLEFAQTVAQLRRDPVQPTALGQAIMPGVIGEETLGEIALADSQEQGLAMLLVSPEFLRR